MDLGQFGKEFLYSALIALIFAGTGRVWSQITHRKASGVVSMQMEIFSISSQTRSVSLPAIGTSRGVISR